VAATARSPATNNRPPEVKDEHPPKLLDDDGLEPSSVVAHRFMNRERELRGRQRVRA
jgi:hypothetical protein